MNVWEHFEEMRGRLLFVLVVFVVVAAGCYLISDHILRFLTHPLEIAAQRAYFVSPYDAFLVKLQVTFWSALFLSSPILLTELWLFVAPGLLTHEKMVFWTVLIASILLFSAGVAFSMLFIIPATIRFFLGFSTPELQPLISIEKYLSFVIWMSLGFGLSFQMPIGLVGLVRLGILTPKQLSSVRRYAVIGIFIFSAVITPTPDPVTQCLLALPLWMLFEIALFVASAFGLRRHSR